MLGLVLVLGDNQAVSPRKIVPQLGLRVGLGLVLGLGRGAIVLNPLCENKTAHVKKII